VLHRRELFRRRCMTNGDTQSKVRRGKTPRPRSGRRASGMKNRSGSSI
jgi:hypothetical protein